MRVVVFGYSIIHLPPIFSLAFTIHARSYVTSSILKNFLPHSNSLKLSGALITSVFELSVTKGSSSFVSFTFSHIKFVDTF